MWTPSLARASFLSSHQFSRHGSKSRTVARFGTHQTHVMAQNTQNTKYEISRFPHNHLCSHTTCLVESSYVRVLYFLVSFLFSQVVRAFECDYFRSKIEALISHVEPSETEIEECKQYLHSHYRWVGRDSQHNFIHEANSISNINLPFECTFACMFGLTYALCTLYLYFCD